MTDPTEPVIASLHAVAQRATSLSVLLYSIEQTTTDGQLREFAAEISMFGTMLQNFQSVLSDFGTKQMAKPALWEDLQGVLQLMQEICDAVESLISSTKGSLGKAAIHLGRNKAKWQHARKRLEVVKSTLILMMSVIRLAGETYGIPKLQQSLESAREDFANLSFVHSISARYQRYLDPDHGLKFVPSESHKLSLDSNERSSRSAAEDLTAERISDDQVIKWVSSIKTVGGTSTELGRSPSSSLHLVMCTVDPEDMDSSVTIPFSMGSFLGIFEGFSLPAAYLQSIFTGTARSLRYAESDDAETQGFIYRSPSSRAENWALALSWDKSLQVTTGMILGLLPNELDVFLAFMKASRSELLHPMYLPVILCEMQTDLESDNVKRHSLNLFKVELQTRMHTYDYASLLEPSKDLDYDDITRKLNGIISRLSFHQMRLETTLESLKYIEQCERHFRGDERLAESLHARIEQISDEGRALLAEVYCNQRIAQSQLDVVYNLVVQRDNRSNLKMAAASRDIAEAAKEDSSAMRTLAFMSIVFLPATFVASFFSMSMFDWRAAQWSSIASHRLWFYWAVSIPLTLIIMVIWYIWLRRDLDQEHTSRRARHNLATMGFKDISMSMDGTQTSKEHRSWSYPRMRKKKYAQDQEAGHADPHLHTPNSKFKGPNIKPFERVHTGQGPRR